MIFKSNNCNNNKIDTIIRELESKSFLFFVCGPSWGSFTVEDHFRSFWGVFAALYSTFASRLSVHSVAIAGLLSFALAARVLNPSTVLARH